MKKLAIFDLGQVCVRIHIERCNEIWLRLAGKESLGEGEFAWKEHDCYERGEIEAPELWAALRKTMGLNLSDAQWLEGWNSIFGEEIVQTRSTIKQMKAAGLRVVALSNTNRAHVEVWKPLYSEFLDMFDQIYVSNEMGMRKPESRIYEKLLELEGFEGRDAVFFDDKIENIESARKLGIEAVHFDRDAAAWDWWAESI
ncbi:MAG: HAD-IA family hydrolase [Symploca sp. SIO2D2]|nr:HAD-IA family hydrolase [Symploca sp. SIO2D2]